MKINQCQISDAKAQRMVSVFFFMSNTKNSNKNTKLLNISKIRKYVASTLNKQVYDVM